MDGAAVGVLHRLDQRATAVGINGRAGARSYRDGRGERRCLAQGQGQRDSGKRALPLPLQGTPGAPGQAAEVAIIIGEARRKLLALGEQLRRKLPALN
ncbi:MAG: hypothetical protein ACREYE_27450 [Gammaproteobacteria bacterium]